MLTALAAALGFHALTATERNPVLDGAPSWCTESDRPVLRILLIGGDGCDVTAPMDSKFHRSTQTRSGVDIDTDVAHMISDTFENNKAEMPFGLTDGLQLDSVGLVIGQRRRHKRRRRRRRHSLRKLLESDDEKPSWMTGAMAGLWTGLVLVYQPAACTVWVSVTLVMGVWMLATDRHFWWPVCAVLSLNYWFAAAWIGWTASPGVGVVLAALAAVVRGSAMLFPKGECIELSTPHVAPLVQ